LKSKGDFEWGNSISIGQTLTVWDIKQKGLPLTDLFPNFWQNCLVIIDPGTDNPQLIWGPIPDFEATGYKIYRAIGNSSGLSKINYSLIETTSANTFDYIDEDIDLSDSQYVFYYMAAYNSNTNSTSEPSNVVTTRGGMYKQNQLSEEHKTGNIKYELSQNTPNPFNPSTRISFTVPSSTEYYPVLQNVTLKVYNILGNEVATLVDENKPAGNYEVKFNAVQAASLSSGVYFYTLKSGSFSETKKMLLLK